MKFFQVMGAVGCLTLLCTQAFGEVCPGTKNSPGNTYASCGRTNVEGNCTRWVAHMRPDLNFPRIMGHPRDANQWIWYAKKYGYQIESTPIVGSVVVFSNGPNGHVAYVISVDGNSFTVLEQDYYGSLYDYNNPKKNKGTLTGVYRLESNGLYSRNARHDTAKGGWTVLGFIYPSRTILYNRHQIDGALVMFGTDGKKIYSCGDVEKATLFSLDTLNKDKLYAHVAQNVTSAQQLCKEAKLSWGLHDINFGEKVKGRSCKVVGRYNGQFRNTDPTTSFRFTPQKVIDRCRKKIEGNLTNNPLRLKEWQNLKVIKHKKVFDPQTQGNLYDVLVSGTMTFYNEGAPKITMLCRSLGGEKGIMAIYKDDTAVFIHAIPKDQQNLKTNRKALIKEIEDETFIPTARDMLSQALEQTKKAGLPLF